jgi:hypothetical protein
LVYFKSHVLLFKDRKKTELLFKRHSYFPKDIVSFQKTKYLFKAQSVYLKSHILLFKRQ